MVPPITMMNAVSCMIEPGWPPSRICPPRIDPSASTIPMIVAISNFFSIPLFGLSSLSRLFGRSGLSCSSNQRNRIDQTDRTDRIDLTDYLNPNSESNSSASSCLIAVDLDVLDDPSHGRHVVSTRIFMLGSSGMGSTSLFTGAYLVVREANLTWNFQVHISRCRNDR